MLLRWTRQLWRLPPPWPCDPSMSLTGVELSDELLRHVSQINTAFSSTSTQYDDAVAGGCLVLAC